MDRAIGRAPVARLVPGNRRVGVGTRRRVTGLQVHEVSGVRVVRTADVASADDFALGPARALAVDAFLAEPHTSLFALDRRRDEALFVVHGDPERVRAQPFLYEAQRAHALAVVRVPLERLIEWSQRDEGLAPALLFCTARSGSTLLVRALDRVPHLHGISEPDVFTQIAEDRRLATDPRITAIVRASARFLFGCVGRPRGRMVLKFRTQVLAAAEILRAAWPDTAVMFLHRELVPSVESFLQAFVPPRQYGIERRMGVLFEQYLRLRIRRDGHGFARHLWPPPGPPPVSALATLGSSYSAVAYWLAAHGWVALLRRAGARLLTINHDDLVHSTLPTMERVLSHCGAGATHAEATLSAFAEHSQRGSRVVRSRGTAPWLGDHDIDRLSAFMREHGARYGVESSPAREEASP
jgi:hypothetical protein